MGTWGTAGASAREGYRSAEAGRVRALALRSALLVGCAGGGWLGYTYVHGRGRLITLGLLGAVGAAAVLFRADPDPGRWLRGAAGEVGTAEALARLSERRWHVFHDLAVPGSRANIDHLVVGRTGVWVIDTKTTRAAVRVGFGCVRFGDRRLSTESVRWQAEMVSERLGVPARPVIALNCEGPPRRSRMPRRGVRREGVRIVPVPQLTRRLKHGGRRFTQFEADALADEVLARFRAAGGRDRQNEAARRRPLPNIRHDKHQI